MLKDLKGGGFTPLPATHLDCHQTAFVSKPEFIMYKAVPYRNRVATTAGRSPKSV
jgi:hypothetical protein